MSNIVFISKEDTQLLTDADKANIKSMLEQHNRSLFDANDRVEEDVEYNADYTCIGGEDAGFYGERCGHGRESCALSKLNSGIARIIEEA